jgi:transcriptional regulator of heat shock response
MLEPRLAQLLKLIVERYVQTAQPVSSKELCDTFGLTVSSATVRNYMAELEAQAFIVQPHTSAGRIPTEKAYRYYIANLSKEAQKRTVMNVTITIQRITRAPTMEERLHALAKDVAQASGEAVMVATSRPWSATVGVGNLLRKPDFRTDEAIEGLAKAFERFDGALQKMLRVAGDDVKVVLGMENPLGPDLASVVVRHRLPDGTQGVMSIIGPMRMDYPKNMAILSQAKKIIEGDKKLLT